MKKVFFTGLLVILLSVSFISCNNDDDNNSKQNIDFSALPEIAKTFIQVHFSTATVKLVQLSAVPDSDGSIYDVFLSNGFEIDFNAEGHWTDVDGKRRQKIPTAIMLPAINDYIATNYPNLFATSIEVKIIGYEVELNNDLDLIFDKQGNFIRIDR